MLKSLRMMFACAALVFAAASFVRAEERLPDFDQLDFNVREIVAERRAAAREAQSTVESGKVSAKQEAAPDDSVLHRIVVFKPGSTPERRLAAVQAAGGTVTKDLWLINAVAVVTPRVRLSGFERSLSAATDVKRVEADFLQNWLEQLPAAPAARARAGAEPNGGSGQACPPWWPPTWPCPNPDPPPDDGGGGQTVPWGIKRVNAAGAWETTRGGGVKVAVIDTGIDFDHPDIKAAGGYNAIDKTASYKDDHGHGTHVSGTIAALDNGKGVVGVAPDVTLYGVKVLNAQGSGTYENIIDGVQWCVKNGIQIANMSLGASQGTPALADAMKAAAQAGLVVIAAAGNSGGAVGYPAAYPDVIAIAASDSNDRTASFSSRGPEVDFIAPGVDVNSTFMGGGYRKLSGTSMAAPHATGLAALAAARGARGIEGITEAFKKASTKLPDLPDEQQGMGFIDAGKLVR